MTNDSQQELYSDNQGDVPQVDNSELTAFTSFILGHEEEGDDGLNLADIDGISCDTVHPYVRKISAEVVDFCEAHDATPPTMLTRLQQQVNICLASDVLSSIVENLPDEAKEQGVMLLDIELLSSILMHMGSMSTIIYEALAPKFDDNKSLIIAKKMAEYIEATTDGDLPFFWDEVQSVLAGYKEADTDATDK